MAEPDVTEQLVNFEQVQTLLKREVDAYLAEKKSSTPEHIQSEQQQAQKQVRELLDPFIKPDLDEARFLAADAKDFVSFYADNPEGIEYKEDVEKAFEVMKKSGRPTTRAGILDYVIGNERRTQPDKFKEKETARQKRQLEKAEMSTDFGGNAVNRAKNDVTFSNLEGKSLEEIEKAMDGVTF